MLEFARAKIVFYYNFALDLNLAFMKNYSALLKYAPFVLIGIFALGCITSKVNFLALSANVLIYALVCGVLWVINSEYRSSKTKTAFALSVGAILLCLMCAVIYLSPDNNVQYMAMAGLMDVMRVMLMAVSFILLAVQFKEDKLIRNLAWSLAGLLILSAIPWHNILYALGFDYNQYVGIKKVIIFSASYISGCTWYAAICVLALFCHFYCLKDRIRESVTLNALEILSVIYVVIAVLFSSTLWCVRLDYSSASTASYSLGGAGIFPVVSLGIAVMLAAIISVFIHNRIMALVSGALLIIWPFGACVKFYLSIPSFTEYYIYNPIICAASAFIGGVLLVVGTVLKMQKVKVMY